MEEVNNTSNNGSNSVFSTITSGGGTGAVIFKQWSRRVRVVGLVVVTVVEQVIRTLVISRKQWHWDFKCLGSGGGGGAVALVK